VLDTAPSRKLLAERAVTQLITDLQTLAIVTDNCHSRIVDGAKIPMCDKVLSVSDPDAGYIHKGQREAVIGYKPQIARSRNGFITSIKLPRGNAADSAQLLDLVDDTTTRTGVNLRVVSVDDGYASTANMKALKQRNVEVVSINGAKGRKLTTDDDWNSPGHTEARGIRSAVESLMYTLKQGFNFDEVARRGLTAVLRGTIIPHLSPTRADIGLFVAILGTTISPYLFFWQTSEEVEEQEKDGTTDDPLEPGHLRHMRVDILAGMGSAVIVMFAIMVASGATLGAHGITTIKTAAQAARTRMANEM